MFTLTDSPAVWILLSFSLRFFLFFLMIKKNVIMTVFKSAKTPSSKGNKKGAKVK